MQPTGIQPSQLLMEVMASAKEKIGQEICRSSFSQQLHEQHQLAQNAPVSPSTATILQSANPLSSISPASSQPSLSQSSGESARLSEAAAIINGTAKGAVPVATTNKNLVVSKWKIAQELTFTDSVALEKVLAQYQLPPSVSTAIRNALDEQGQLSLQKLTQILDRVSTNAGDAAPDGRAAAEEIQSLLTAVLQQKELPAQTLKSLAIPSKASYDFGEFRDLLRQFVDRSAKASVKQAAKSAKSPLPQSAATDAAATTPVVETTSPSRTRLPNQTKSLTTNLIPSFMRDSRGPFDDLNSRMPTAPIAVPVDNETARTVQVGSETLRKEIPTADEGGTELPVKTRQSAVQSNGTLPAAGTGDVRNTADWLSVLTEWSQTLHELISETVSQTPQGTAPSPAIELEAALPAGPSAIADAGNDLARQIDATLDSTALDQKGVPPSSANILASASNTGATAFWAMRSAPAESSLTLDANAVDQTIAAKATVPVVEKIAAPATAAFTSSDPESSGGRDAALNNSALHSYQDARRPAVPLGTPSFSDYEPEASTAYSEPYPTDPTELSVAGAARETSEITGTAEPARRTDPGTLFRDVTRMQVTSRPDIPGTDASPAKTVEAPIATETPSPLNRPQTTAAPELFSTDAPLTEPVKAQTATEIPQALNRPQVTIAPHVDDHESSFLRAAAFDRPVASVPSTPAAASESTEVSPLGPARDEFASLRAGMAQSAPIPTETTERSTLDAPQASSERTPLPSFENPPQATFVAATKVEEASLTPRTAAVPTPEAPAGPTLTAALRSVPGKPASEMPSNPQASSATAEFVATDYGKSFFEDLAHADVKTPASASERSLELSGLPEGNAEVPILKPIVSEARATGIQQDSLPEFKPLKGMASAPRRDTEAVIVSQKAGTTAEDLTPAGSVPAERASDPAATVSPSRIASPLIAEGSTGPQKAAGQAVFSTETEAGLRNSVELLAKGPVDSETTAGQPTPVSPDVAERTTRQNPLENGAREIAAEAKGNKAVPVPPGSDQAPSQGQGQDKGQDHPATWFRNDVQMATLSANPAADKAAELFSSYTSSLTAELAQRIQELHRQSRHELTLELEPEHLGRLRVRIGAEENQVSTLISTESEQVKELLNRGSAALRQELASQGLVLDKLQIDVNSQGTADERALHQQGSGRRRHGAHQQAAAAPDRGFAEPNARRTPLGHADSLISLFV